MEEEIQLEFRRFSDEKQEQVRQLVAYITLMGLTGKDLVSIGGKLDRIEKRKQEARNLAIGLSYQVVPVGRSVKDRAYNESSKWFWTDSLGTKWRFDRETGYSVIVKNCMTNKHKYFYFNNAVGAKKNYVANVMYHVHIGEIVLNF